MRQGARLNRLFIIGGICLFTAFFYRDMFSVYFLGDDLGFLYYAAEGVRQGRSLLQLLDEFITPPYRGEFFYRPVTFAFFLGDFLFYGANPTGWHVTNLLLHLVNVALLGCLIEQIAGKGTGRRAVIVAGAAAATFALRPSAPETVVWLSGRTDELVLTGFLAALLAYLRAEGRWGRFYLLAIGGFVFALGSKEAGVTLPGALVALHLAGTIPIRSKDGERYCVAWFRQTLKGVGPFAFILLLYFIWRLVLFGSPFRVYREAMPLGLNDPGWWAVKLYALRFFLAPAAEMTSLSKVFLTAVSIQALVGLIASLQWPEVRRLWVFGGCCLMTVLLPLAQQLYIAPTGEGARLLYIPGAALAVLLVSPLIACVRPSGPCKIFGRTLFLTGSIGITLVVLLSVSLLRERLQPWIEAGLSMKSLVGAIAARAETVPGNGFAVLLVPDHFDGALFARNGQGALMEPPVQRKVLGDRVIVLTPPTLGPHAPTLASSYRQNPGLEHWCWDLEGRRFERLGLPEHGPDAWGDAWRLALRHSSCRTLADELDVLYP